MASSKIIQQPDILNLESLGAFMDAQNDVVIPLVEGKVENESKEVAGPETVTPASDKGVSEAQEDPVSSVSVNESIPKKSKVAKSRRGKQVKVQPVIEAGSGEWDMMVKYAEYYNDNPDEDRITVVLNPEVKRALDIIRINCRQFNFGNILNAVCRTFIERNKEQILKMQKDKGNIL